MRRAGFQPRPAFPFLRSVLAALCAGMVSACASLPGAPSPVDTAFATADTIHRSPIAPGVAHVYVREPDGPWAIHILDIDRAVCRPLLRAAKAGPPLEARALTSMLSAGALAAVNADFFALPGGTPVGAHVTGGQIHIGPGLRPGFAIAEGGVRAGPLRIRGFVAAPGDTLPVTQVNRPLAGDAQHPPVGGATQLTPWLGAATPGDSGASLVQVRVVGGDARAGRGVVRARTEAADPAALQGGLAFSTRERAWADRRAAGDTVTWRVEVVLARRPVDSAPERRRPEAARPDWQAPAGEDAAVAEAVGGFPLLLLDGRDVLAAQPGVSAAFGDARHPRTAVGWNAARLYLVVVDGRQAPYSDGMTLPELRDLFLKLGARTALNLDGGGSSTMVVGGAVVSRPSDREGERAVGNALVLDGCRDG